jgi:hypothetical protein
MFCTRLPSLLIGRAASLPWRRPNLCEKPSTHPGEHPVTSYGVLPPAPATLARPAFPFFPAAGSEQPSSFITSSPCPR